MDVETLPPVNHARTYDSYEGDGARQCREATAIVLAGGRSTRMGAAKALLRFDNTPLIAHVVAKLRAMFGDVVVVAAPGQELPDTAATVVYDVVGHQGPVGGIFYGLDAARTDVSFVAPCDAPFVRPGLIAKLVSLIPQYDVVAPRWNGRLQPLHAVYRKTVAPRLAAQLSRDERRLTSLLDHVRVRTVDEDDIRRFDPEGASFFNVNTPEDYAEALKRWSAGQR